MDDTPFGGIFQEFYVTSAPNRLDLYWQLQTPSGKIEGTNLEATNDPGQSGTYVGLYQPDACNNNRGVWLFTMS